LPWFSPTRLGWDEFFGNLSGGLDYFSKINHNGDHDLFEDEVEVEDLRYYTHIITEKATTFLRRRHSPTAPTACTIWRPTHANRRTSPAPAQTNSRR